MIFEFINLSPEEKEQILAFEMDNPDCIAREVSASFDGYTAIQLLTPENIASAAQVLVAAIGMITSLSVAKCNAEATIKAAEAARKAAEASAEATIKAAEANAAAMLEAARINANAAQETPKEEAVDCAARTKENHQNAKEIYVQLSNGERRLIPVGASAEQIKEIIGYREET